MSKYLLVCIGIALVSVAEARIIVHMSQTIKQAKVKKVTCVADANGTNGTIELESAITTVLTVDGESCLDVMRVTATSLRCLGYAVLDLKVEALSESAMAVKPLSEVYDQGACR